MNDCAAFRDDLDASRDNSLDTRRQCEVLEHLKICTACRQQSERAAAIEQQLRNEASGWTPTAGLWERIKYSASLKSAADRASRRRFYQQPWAVVALLMMALGAASFSLLESTQADRSQFVATALVNEFHTFVVSHRELDYQDSRPTAIRKWFGDKLDFRVPLPLKTDGLQLAGGRLCNMFDQRIASFMYQVDDAWVSLYIMRSKPERSSATNQELLLQGYSYIDWESQGLHFSLVGDVAIDRLRQIATSLQATQLLSNRQDFQLTSIQRRWFKTKSDYRNSNA